jgi:hypothetical protein
MTKAIAQALAQGHAEVFRTQFEALDAPRIVNSDREVLCPHCGFNYTHHSEVVVYERLAEDAEVVKTTVTGGRTIVELGGKGNPSRRRGGVSLKVLCESCHSLSTLTFAQVEGTTRLRWSETRELSQDEYEAALMETL